MSQFTSKLSKKKPSTKKSTVAATVAESTSKSAAEGLLKAAKEMANVFVVQETQFQRSEDQEAVNLVPDPEGESQDLLIAPSGTVARSVSPTPPPVSDKLDKVTLAFVYELVKDVVPKFMSLAAVEERLTNFESMVKGQTPIATELRIERKLPHLAQGCKFSVRARAEVEKMNRAHDLEYVTRLRDDLKDKVIPACEAELELVLEFARNRLEAECPEDELHAARRQFEKEMEKKRENRAELFRQKKNPSAAQRKRKSENQPSEQQTKQPRKDGPPPQWWGPPQRNQWRQREGLENPYEKAGWREAPVRGRGRGRGRWF